MDTSEALEFRAAGHSVSALWTPATRPFAVAAIAHGAGAGMTHPFMTGAAEGLAADGVSGRRPPDGHRRPIHGRPDREIGRELGRVAARYIREIVGGPV